MFRKIALIILSLLLLSSSGSAQEKEVRKMEPIRVGIINGKATFLPKPEYPEIAEELCAGGKVELAVLVNEEGKVIEAEAISGDELLFDTSINAAKKSIFPPHSHFRVKVRGLVVYNFDSYIKKKCIEAGVLNGRAQNLPAPVLGGYLKSHLRFQEEAEVKVRVLIDINEGKVISAHPIGGHPLFRKQVKEAALKARFEPFSYEGNIYAKGMIIYRVKADKSIEAASRDQISIGNAIYLAEPKISMFCGKASKNEKIIIQADIDENGNIAAASGISGHPFFRAICLANAKLSKFYPSMRAGRAIKVKALIIYEFSGIEIKAIRAEIKAPL